MARSRWLRALRWTLLTLALVLATGYALGGRELFRDLLRFRNRAAQLLEPPTQQEMQQAPPEPAPTAAADVPTMGGEPASLGTMILWTTLPLLLTLVLVLVTAGRRRQRRH